jgi:protein transport protein SEC61 subunit gamma-like protein|tara:strand:- start:6409 stop:6702 length:294 start_codon:yes stop_codon:yes gene_type:complete
MRARTHVHVHVIPHTPTRAGRPRLAAPSTMEVADVVAKPMRDFAKDSVRLVKKCTKPDAREFWKIASRTATGFVVMGFVGFFVKLIFVPINQIILSS